ncbi:MAG: FkbM family methyltransferase [Alphaproteobacteria bacterium]|nr:MAG: FkbM family methyltransferase [Alphaproteobacteria bacterium]
MRRVIRKLRAVWCQITINKQYLFLAGQLAAHTDEMRREIYELKKALWENADISFTQLEIAIQTKDNTPSAEPMQGQNTSSALPRPPNLPIPPSVTSVEGEEIDRDQQLIWHLSQLDKLGYRPGNRVAVNCGPDQILVRTQVGYVFCSAHDPVVLCALAETGELEHGTRLAIQRILQPGETFIDVGAHLGLHTIAAARVLKDHGRVIAFEPFPLTCSLLRKSVELNNLSSLVEIHNAAVSNRAESRPLFLGSISGHHSLFPLPDEEKAGVAPVEVPTMRLDQVIEPGQKADMIKIDAEGAELDVLEGARTLIEANPEIVLVVEFGPSHLRRVGHMPSDWLARFADLGLIYRVINEQTGNLESWPYHKLLDVYSVNLLFARPDASVWQRS